MTFAEMIQELADRGHQDISPARRGRFINDARQWLDNLRTWPYREASVEGYSPVAITDLGRVDSVSNETMHYPLAPQSYASLLANVGDLSLPGLPQVFYVAWPYGAPVVGTWPTDPGSVIGVQYWRRTPPLVDASDEPAAPADYHLLLCDIATQACYRDTENFTAAAALDPVITQKVQGMITALMGGQQDAGPQDDMGPGEGCDG